MPRRRPKIRKILGIDPSLTRTAVCAVRVGKLTEYQTETCDPKKHKGFERVAMIARMIETWVYAESPDTVFIEGYAMGRGKMRGTFDIAECVSVVKLVALSRGIPIIVIPPTTLKQFVSGKGNATKGEVMASLKQHWGVSFTDDDRADAFACTVYGQYLLDRRLIEEDSSELVAVRKQALRKHEVIQGLTGLKPISFFAE